MVVVRRPTSFSSFCTSDDDDRAKAKEELVATSVREEEDDDGDAAPPDPDPVTEMRRELFFDGSNSSVRRVPPFPPIKEFRRFLCV